MQLYKTSGRVIWLMPGPDDTALWQRTISSLSRFYKTPLFEPHITLGRLTELPHDQTIQQLTRFSVSAKPVRVPLSDPVCTDHLFQKVIIPFENSLFSGFSTHFKETFGNESAKKRNFHLSLMYGTLSCSHIDLERVRNELPDSKYLYIQQVVLAEIAGHPGDWKILCKRSL
jgi:hypothetical protein